MDIDFYNILLFTSINTIIQYLLAVKIGYGCNDFFFKLYILNNILYLLFYE